MAFPTTGNTTELHAVNQILASVGQAPVTTLDQTNPDVAICYTTLLDVSRQVQAEGWTFNKEYNYPIQVNSQKHIPVPNNVLAMDLSDSVCGYEFFDVIRRTHNGEDLIYDRNAHTFEFDDKTYYFDMTWYFDWKDLPIPIQEFITARAASIVSQRIVGDTNLYQILQQQEAYLRAQAMEYECNQGDYTFFGHPQGSNFYRSYQPFHALYR